MSDDANAEPVNISHALGTELLALLDILARHGLSPRGFVKRSGVAEHDKLGTASALATELLRLSGILRDRGEEGDAERLTAAAKELKGEIAKNWLGRAMAAAFVEDNAVAARHARRCLDAMDWSPGYGPPSVTARLQMANLVADAYFKRVLGTQRAARVDKLTSWQLRQQPLPASAIALAQRRLLDFGAVMNDTTRRLYAGCFVDVLVHVAVRLQRETTADGGEVLPEDVDGDRRATRLGYVRELLVAGQAVLPEHLDCAFHYALFVARAALYDRSIPEQATPHVSWAMTLLDRFQKREAGVYVTDEVALSSLVAGRTAELSWLLARLRARE